MDESKPAGSLRRGWTTGACATAAAKAAYIGWQAGECPDPVEIVLPGGARPAFSLALAEIIAGGARAGVVKDAGDDPDVTHGALVIATIRAGAPGSGVTFRAGEGVGTVTRAGLPLPPGEPAINPVPRQMIRDNLEEAARSLGGATDIEVEIAIPGGEAIAQRTLNPRLGILGGLSILGTTGVVVPYSCAAWIHSIYRGIDVARAGGLDHVAGATGSTSEKAVQALHDLPEQALIDMGDFVGGMLKYLRRNPVPKVTIAGGFAKMTKLGQGLLDLHSRSGAVDLDWLAERLGETGADASVVMQARSANTALEVLETARSLGLPLGDVVAQHAWGTAAKALRGASIALEVAVFDRNGQLVGRVPFHPVV
ncbi:cobalt-precorrin-5B (C(1))-methyltransferase [Microvirga arsenatis]|uniref:Cobalt-precorrin-5B C(1)-methyltransferase n=1 Tax=Microvirga arsenatis TaxID=2692265 RepID=A0ABW9YTX5_9HYPH|nr:cobalt-precorrin-5B (C(1))-methyltransferase [Microvirga arsenatis]NBJ09877.1 cobalt-precorrin-5B (C(1))-methyltransferase [Microvirga arsenatis]NBJ22945.1 cobalt-precorrin-5B (C(1))-methyltransferase [Microvirga arsenatis]